VSGLPLVVFGVVALAATALSAPRRQRSAISQGT
jgi:hypothetical protein